MGRGEYPTILKYAYEEAALCPPHRQIFVAPKPSEDFLPVI